MRFLRFVLTLAFAAAWFGLFGYGAYRGGAVLLHAAVAPMGGAGAAPVTVVVPEGATTREVADALHRHHLIRHPLVLVAYAKVNQLDGSIKSGEYNLSAAMSVGQMVDKLIKGQVVVQSFTVPEGLTVVAVADLLAARQLVDRRRFLDLAANSDLVATYLPANASIRQPLEGYLFPDTYQVKKGVTAEQILQLMVNRFKEVMKPEYRERARELGLSLHQVLTLASIIEEEAQVARERPLISSVYSNRLEAGMKLDADPTVAYALDRPAGQPLTGKDLAVDSPYNTYRVAGLPPGPISAPGADSIKAALYPAKTDYLYFVAKEDGSGEHIFSRTYQEHLTAIALVQKR